MQKNTKVCKNGEGGVNGIIVYLTPFPEGNKEIENINIINLISVQNEKQITCLNGTLRCDFVNTSLVGRMG